MRQGIVALGAIVATVVAFLAACRSNPPAPSARELATSFGLEVKDAASDGVPIQVVDAKSGRPVADALVVSVDEIEFTYNELDEFGVVDSLDLLRELGTAYVTDARGTTRVAAPDFPQFLLAWHGGTFGRSTLEVHDRTEQVIAVGPSDLVVEVVDRRGRPQARVPVVLGQCSISPEYTCIEVGSTDEDGRFPIAPLDLARSVHRTCGYDDLVMLGLAGGNVIRPLDAPRTEPIRFALPACGELVVELRDTMDRPVSQWLEGKERLRLVVTGEPGREPRGVERNRPYAPTREVEVLCSDAPIHLKHVELGMALSFDLELRPDVRRLLTPEHAIEGADVAGDGSILGPTRAGEIVHVLLRLEAPTVEPEPDERDALMEEARTAAREAAIAANSETTPEEPDPATRCSIELRTITDFPIDACTLRARIDDDVNPTEHNTCPWIGVDGRATMRNIGAGRHSITIVTSSFDRTRREIPLWRIEEVEVPPSVHLRDPRLLAIDLRGKIQRSSIDVVDEAGQPLSGRLMLVRAGDEVFAESIYFREGHCDLVTAADDPCRLVVAVDRFRPVELRTVPAQQRIVMKRGLPIRLVLDPRALQLGDRVSKLYVGVSERPRCGLPPDEGAEDETVRTVEIGPGGTASFEVPEPGDWRVVFLHRHRGADGDEEECNLETPEECDLETPMEATIHVEERAQEQRFTVAPLRWMEPVQERDADEPEDSPSSHDDG